MLPEKQVLSKIIIYNQYDLMAQVNPVWFADLVNLELWKNLVYCFAEHKKLDTEILKTWIFNRNHKLKNNMINRLKSLDEVYPPDKVIENLQEYYVQNCLNKYMQVHNNLDVTLESKKQAFNETYKKINTNIELDESKSLHENINDYIKNVLDDTIGDRFNTNSIELTSRHFIQIFGKYLRPWPVVIAGNPGYHKTSFLVNLLVEIDRQKLPGLIFSFEDTIDTLRNKFIAIKTGVSIDSLVNNNFNNVEKDLISRATDKQNRAWIIEKPCNVLKLRQIVDKHVITYGIKYILLDYFQLCYGLKGLSKVEGLEMIAKELVCIRKDYEIPIICLSQLNTEDGQTPQLTDLKWCKALGENARQVFMLSKGSSDDDNIRNIACRKNTFFGQWEKEIEFDPQSQKIRGVYAKD